MVQSELERVKINRIVVASGFVSAGQIIAELDDLDLQTQLNDKNFSKRQQEIARDTSASQSEKENSTLEIKRLDNSIAFINKQIEKCKVRSPFDGIILTSQLKRMEGQVINKGDLICEVADLDKWELLLDVKQEEIDWVQQGCAVAGDNGTSVVFFLETFPQDKLTAKITDVNQIGQMARIKEEGNVYEIRLDVSSDQLAKIKDGLRSGMVGRAKIATVSKPLGYVLLRKVIRFFRVTFF